MLLNDVDVYLNQFTCCRICYSLNNLKSMTEIIAVSPKC